MKIKIALLEIDQIYMERLMTVLNTGYADKLEVYSFTDPSAALATVNSAKIDILIANDTFQFKESDIPSRCSFAYFADTADIDMIGGHKVIGRFQKVELIYKQILDIYSEKAECLYGYKGESGNVHTILFHSISGGAGASTMAAAYSVYLAARQKKVLYLNLEKFGSSQTFFKAEGQFDMSHIIYALKSKKSDVSLKLKLESSVRQDGGGVFFYACSKTALDMFEMDCDEMLWLVSELKKTNDYDYIVIDMDFIPGSNLLKIYQSMKSVMWIGDGSEISNEKVRRAFSAVLTLEQSQDLRLSDKIALVYNKFSSKTGKIMEDTEMKCLGGLPRYECMKPKQIMMELSKAEIFGEIEKVGNFI